MTLLNDQIAGRNLDAMVASEVMGWTDVRERRWGEETVLAGRRPTGELTVVPRYSDSMDQAWKVVGFMREKGWIFRLGPGQSDSIWDGVERWTAIFARPMRADWARDIDGAERAICLAAIEAMREYQRMLSADGPTTTEEDL